MKISKYFEIGKGTVPILLSCPHGGYKEPKRIPNKAMGAQNPDRNTYFIAKQILWELSNQDIHLYYILNKVHRSKVDVNRPPRSKLAFNQSSIEAKNIHQLFHDQLLNFSQECILNYNKALIIDLHGFTKPYPEYPDIIFGNIFGKTLKILQNPQVENCDKYWGCSQLYNEIVKSFTLDDGLALSDINIAYSGGYITHRFYNVPKVNAIQLELAKFIRMNQGFTKKFIRSIVNGIVNISI
jgi:N-formylglutamate amidohydrolase